MALLKLLAALALLAVQARSAPLNVEPNMAQFAVPDGEVANAQTSQYFGTIYPNNATAGPDQCVYEQLGVANAVGIHVLAVPTTDKYAILELPYGNHPLIRDYSTGCIQDIADRSQWAPVWSNDSIFCSGHSHTADGWIMMAGGHVLRQVGARGGALTTYEPGLQHVRMFKFDEGFNATTNMNAKNNKTNYLSVETSMYSNRWYPSTILLPDNRIAIVGGVNAAGNSGAGVQKIEIFDPKNPNQFPLDGFDMEDGLFQSHETKPFYPFQWILPTGHMFMYHDTVSRIVNPYTGNYIKDNNGNFYTTPPRPGGAASNYPFTASGVMLALDTDPDNNVNSADFLIVGGSYYASHPNHTVDWKEGYNVLAPGARVAHRITIFWKRQGGNGPWQYTFSDWQEDDLGYPRVMPDATLLPCGDVTILNGAQTGVAGYPIRDGTTSCANFPNFWAALYQPNLPQDNRVTLLCGTTRVRQYHANAVLTTEGKVLITGADRNEVIADAHVPWFHGSGGEPPNYYMELFHPPYVYDTANQPMIQSINGSTDPVETGYNMPMTIQWGPGPNATQDVNVTSVAMCMPSSTTHSFNFNQRCIRLRIISITPNEVQVITPKQPFIAIPSWYMLFINNVKTYSTAKWVKLVDYEGLGQTIQD